MRCPKCKRRVRGKWLLKKCKCKKCGYDLQMGDYMSDWFFEDLKAKGLLER